ncbi:MAG TPA: hypothetical protein VNE39_03455 [Planctomycetota bacterium]|nr:hypothetical protein [Planctomycetota bacterium]
MRNRTLPFPAAFLLLASSALAVEVQLTVSDDAQVARKGGVVTSGIPFARGALKDVAKLSVAADGQIIPAQFTLLAPWDDGSVRWALMDCQVDLAAGGKAQLVVRDDGGNKPPPSPVQVADAADVLKLSTGPLELSIDKRKSNLLTSLKVGGKELITSAGRGLVLHGEDGKEVAAGPPSQVTLEQAGPMRAIVCLKGKFPGAHNGLLSYTARLTACAGQRFAKIHVWLENDGARGYGGKEDGEPTNLEWLLFQGLAVELGLGLGPSVAASCEDVAAQGRLKVLQYCVPARDPARAKRPPPHGAWHTFDDLEYTITSDDKELKKGDRTDGIVAFKGEAGSLTAAIHAFWQNYEKAIELEGTTLRLWLWPLGFQWPRHGTPTEYMSVYDRNLTARVRKGLYNLPGGTHKGHELILDFAGRSPQETAAELSAPLFALASAAYYAATDAAPGLFAPPEVRTGNAECDAKLDAWMRMTRSAADPESPTSLFRARQQVVGRNLFWFGWMDFGDIAVPGRGPCSLHYDWPWVLLLDALRTGDVRFLRLATDMARHRVDVDQHWSDRERPEFRGLMLRDDNYPDYHCYRLYRPPDVTSNWLAGAVFYYLLTGEPKALECCRRNAEALKPAWAWIAQKKPWAGPQGNMAAIAWTMDSYCAMYDLTADRSWLDEAMKLFDTHVAALRKNHGPHLFNPDAQVRGQDYQEEDIKYCYAIQFLCQLHHRTGAESVLKLLEEGCGKKFPSTFFDAPIFLSGLYAYVGHVTGNKDYLANAAELFAEGFPESKSPPVFLPDNSVWSRQAAMMLRTGHLLQWAHWKGGGGK